MFKNSKTSPIRTSQNAQQFFTEKLYYTHKMVLLLSCDCIILYGATISMHLTDMTLNALTFGYLCFSTDRYYCPG